MRRLRQIHLLLGCFFAPFLIYFAVSGTWQTLEWHKGPKGQPANTYALLSEPHVSQTMPGAIPKVERSHAFKWFVVLMGFGFIATTVLGVYMAWRIHRQRWIVLVCLVGGFLIPIAFMWGSLRSDVPWQF